MLGYITYVMSGYVMFCMGHFITILRNFEGKSNNYMYFLLLMILLLHQGTKSGSNCRSV